MISLAVVSGGAGAQGTPQTVDLVKVDVQKLAAGYRASKVIGSSVVNDRGETIGKIDDLLVSADGKQPYAVLSVGGFLGMGTRLVVVPYETLKLVDKKVVLPGGTKEGLKTMPEFKYATG
jgi:sporulation protein YlmC with PRC-barrel domain